ncbi:hypothetical protein E4U33_007935 [Claviceps sp. LM78 group G4]|nr:hypothetical protein E4U33_007935 [Claviceps sp. LM78 group G4]
MATPPQGAGNSTELRTPVNGTQGARDFLVDDGYQFDFGLSPAAFGSTLPDSPRLQSPGGTPVTVGQDADRLITDDRAVKLELFRAMCAAFDEAAAGYATGPGHVLAEHFKQHYLRFWTAALKGEPPSPLPRAAASKPASVASQPEGPTTYTLKTQRVSKRATQQAKAPPAEDLRLLVRLEPNAPTWDKIALQRSSPESQVMLLELFGEDVPGAGGIPSGCLIKGRAHGAEQFQFDGAVVGDEPVGVLADGHRCASRGLEARAVGQRTSKRCG